MHSNGSFERTPTWYCAKVVRLGVTPSFLDKIHGYLHQVKSLFYVPYPPPQKKDTVQKTRDVKYMVKRC